jgi:hypothetical protein
MAGDEDRYPGRVKGAASRVLGRLCRWPALPLKVVLVGDENDPGRTMHPRLAEDRELPPEV